ncbi:MAG: L,D-transpeptidase family protein [Bacteroidia bacterium]
MKKHILFFICLTACFRLQAQSFKASQQKCERVKTAYSEKWEGLKTDLKKKDIKENFEMYLRIFKNDKLVEVWLKSKEQKEYKLFKTYNICASSGVLGPKRRQGDGQVPEGFYNVAAFNPYSSYYLSLGVSYPNASDKIIGKGNLGGDIMIHGNCVTIGCMPLTDNYIKEVYVLAVEAKNNGQQTIPIHIFPTKLDDAGMNFLTKESAGNLALLDFWKNLKTGYDYFERNKMLPKVTVDKSGKYVFN